jgi:hypothetical protein
MKVIHLYGDSIFDNAVYVDPDRAVTDHMRRLLPVTVSHKMWAVDGHTTKNCINEIDGRNPDFVTTPTVAAILSIGGNDALQSAGVLFTPVRTVGESFQRMKPLLDKFRENYEAIVAKLIALYSEVRVCTIYNKIPGEELNIGSTEMLALSLYNDIITEVASRNNLPVIDLRVICDTDECYSPVSPIEPSDVGGERIARAICKSLDITV